MYTWTWLPNPNGGGLELPLLQPPINKSRRTMPTVAPITPRRLRGNAISMAIPSTRIQSAAMSHGAAGPRGRRQNTAGGALPTVAVSKLAGTVTVNELLVPPEFCARAVLTFLFVPDCGVQITSELGVKFAPVTVNVAFAPAVIVPGDALCKTGTGPSMLKFREFCAPLTLTEMTPELASAEAGTETVSWVPPPVAASCVVPKFTVPFVGKPCPVSVKVAPLEPALALTGKIPVSAEAGKPGNCKSQTPRPCVPTCRTRAFSSSFNEVHSTCGSPVASSDQVAPSLLVAKTPTSVAT